MGIKNQFDTERGGIPTFFLCYKCENGYPYYAKKHILVDMMVSTCRYWMV